LGENKYELKLIKATVKIGELLKAIKTKSVQAKKQKIKVKIKNRRIR